MKQSQVPNPNASACHTGVRMLHHVLLTFLLSITAMTANAQDHDHAPRSAGSPAPFIASTAKPFPVLMRDAMAIMDEGMRRAPMTGSPDHDFASMMIAHHEGAVNMAEALLLYSQDPELRNLAQGIITEQQNEIRIMQAWLERYRVTQSGAPNKPR